MRLNQNILELYFRLLPVQIFLSIASGLSNIVNGLVIGNMLTPDSMIALGLVTPLSLLFAGIASIVSGGSGILCGKFMGNGETKKINTVYSNALIVLMVSGVALTVLFFVFANPLAAICGATAETMEETALYIRGIALGYLPLLIIPTLMIFLQMCNKSNFSLLSTILLAVFNTIFGLIAIRVMKGGIFAVGVATSLSRWATLLVMYIYIRMQKNLVSFDAKKYEPAMIKDILILGSPGSLAGILYSVRNVFINQYASDVGGADAVNSLAIMGSLDCFYSCFNIGVMNTTTMLASVFVGERDSHSLKDLIKISVVVGELLCIPKLVISYLWGDKLAIMFGAHGNVIEMSKLLLIYYAWSAPFNMLTVTLMGTYQSLGRVKFCNILYPINCIIVPLICCIISKYVGIELIWACYMLAEMVTLTTSYIYACFHKKGIVTNLDDMLYLDKDFDTDNKYTVSIDKMDEVVSLAERIQNFCKENGIDDRRSMLSGLCMEEMAGNIVDHGFKKNNRKHMIDVFTCVEDDEVLMRLRDNCVPFDPHTKLEMYSDDDPAKNIGIKMVSKLAKEMNYQTTFGMNVLTIKM